MRRALIALALALVLAVPGAPARADLTAGQRCEGGIILPFVSCVTAGLRWAIIGGPGDDVLTGTWADDVIHSGRGSDVVNGRGGTDTCYVQPRDVVRGCEATR